MRWSRLFDDLDAQAAAAEAAELCAEVADRTRLEIARVSVEDRLRGAVGHALDVQLAGGHRAGGQVTDIGVGWLVVDDGRGTVLVRTLAIVELVGLPAAVGPPLSELEQRIDLNASLRALARDRSAVRIGLADSRTVRGIINRVGADFIDVTTVDGDRRQSSTILTATVSLIRTDRPGS